MGEGVGERRLRERRRDLCRLVRRGLLLGFVIGLGISFVGGFATGWHDAGGRWLGWLVWPALAVSLWLFVDYCRVYFARIDEFDLQHNLWASLVGFYVFVMVLPAWAMLHAIGQVPAPDVWVLWGGSFDAALIAYGWRKLRHRL